MIAGMSICVKFIHVISIAAVLFVGSGCMTAAALHAARGERLDKPNGFKECEENNKKESSYLRSCCGNPFCFVISFEVSSKEQKKWFQRFRWQYGGIIRTCFKLWNS